MPTLSQKRGTIVIAHTALADHSTRAAIVTAGTEVPKGYGGKIYQIEFMTYQGVVDTAKPQGGLVELENGSIDWKPFKFYTPSGELLTTTGATSRVFRLKCNLPLPENSNIMAYYTARDATTDQAFITLFIEYGAYSLAGQTFMDAAKGTAITQITKASAHVTFTAIAATKGGKLKKIYVTVNGTPETAVQEGGQVWVYSDPVWGQPISFATHSMFGKTTMSGTHDTLVEGSEDKPWDADLAEKAVVYADFEPVDDQSQYLEMSIMWARN